jgi:histone deacetylase 11
MRLATGGTILGVHLALRYGWAINLSGGYHHAKSGEGEGFCVFADVPIALKIIWKEKPELKVLIVDLDAHQGNGNSSILAKEPCVSILDMFNASIFPHDLEAEKFVKYRIALKNRTNTLGYLDSLRKWLPIAIENEQPNLIIYNAGTDIYPADPLGSLSVSEEGIIERDNYVFDEAMERNIPILMVLSGGYHKNSGRIIAKSIEAFLISHKILTSR